MNFHPKRSLLCVTGLVLLAACETSLELQPCEGRDTDDLSKTCEMNFGQVIVGQSREKVLRIKNISKEAVTLSPIQLDGSDNFIPDADDMREVTLQADETHEFKITFTPDRTKLFDGRFQFLPIAALEPDPNGQILTKGQGVGWYASGNLAIKVAGAPLFRDGNANQDSLIGFGRRPPGNQPLPAHSQRITIRNLAATAFEGFLLVPKPPTGFVPDQNDMAGLQQSTKSSVHKSYVLDLPGRGEFSFTMHFVPPAHKDEPYYSTVSSVEKLTGAQLPDDFVAIGLVGETIGPGEEAPPEDQ